MLRMSQALREVAIRPGRVRSLPKAPQEKKNVNDEVEEMHPLQPTGVPLWDFNLIWKTLGHLEFS